MDFSDVIKFNEYFHHYKEIYNFADGNIKIMEILIKFGEILGNLVHCLTSIF